jgi:hypothetical protein
MRIFHDLLMLQGHIADPRLARELAGVPDADEAHEPRQAEPGATAALPPERQPDCSDGAVAGARFGRGVTTLCATALSLFR